MKRASLVKGGARRRSTLITMGDEDGATEGFTRRLLMSAVFDITELADTVERIQIQVYTLARAHGVPVPDSDT